MKTLFIGLGGVGQRHLRNLKRLHPEAEILAVRARGRSFEIGDDLAPDRSVDIVKKYGIRLFPDIAQACAIEPDFAVVCNPTSLHLGTTRALIERGVPVFLEKPVSDSEVGLEELARLSEKTLLMVGFMTRFHPCAERLRSLLEERSVGPVLSASIVSHSYLPSWHKYEKPGEFYAGRRELGGGAVLTETHELDLLHWYFGAPARIWAVGGSQSALSLDVEDTAGALLEFEHQGRTFPASVSVSFAQTAPLRRIEVFGERGRISWDILASRLVLEDPVRGLQDVFSVPDFKRNDLFVMELEHFLACLKDGLQPLTSLARVLDGHRTALNIRACLAREGVPA